MKWNLALNFYQVWLFVVTFILGNVCLERTPLRNCDTQRSHNQNDNYKLDMIACCISVLKTFDCFSLVLHIVSYFHDSVNLELIV